MNSVLITGGAGFIGTNVADRLLALGVRVRILDNLSRSGSEQNLDWLIDKWGQDHLEFCRGDVRDFREVSAAVRGVDHIFHFAAQVAVTTSVTDPLTDFAVNAGGTLHVLEAARQQLTPPSLLFTSTNKTYGELSDLAVKRTGTRYVPADDAYAEGVSERRPIDFHSPYGCSKGAADQYVRDYSRIYGLHTVVFRMSCIYGPHQCGNEDQGWVAHFVLQTLNRRLITIYGDGAQVRDILYVEDLVDAFLLAKANLSEITGRIFNIGGGPKNAISLLELIRLLGEIHGRPPRLQFNAWRPGDQRYYVTNYRTFQAAVGWMPKISAAQGVRNLYEWLADHSGVRTTTTAKAS